MSEDSFRLVVDFPLVTAMRSLAVIHVRDQDLRFHATTLETALEAFFQQPAKISAEDFSIVLMAAARLWNELTGDPAGEIDADGCSRLREAALAMHKPLTAQPTLQ